MSQDDRALVTGIMGRSDERAFGVLYDRHTPAMYGLALRLCAGDEPEAQSVVHDAWVRAVERLSTFEWRSTLRSWLCGFVMRCAWELAREAGRHSGPDIDDQPVVVEDVQLRGTFERVDLERAVAALPAGYRIVFMMHDVQGYTHNEIASHLGIAPGTSKSQLAHARAELRRVLAVEGA